jgi:hypothetical protein
MNKDGNTTISNENSTNIAACNKCGMQYKESSINSECPRLGCTGTVKSYPKNVAFISNLLDCAGFQVESFRFPNGVYDEREMGLKFLEKIDFSNTHLPKSFEIIDSADAENYRQPTIINKFYYNMGKADFIKQTAEDFAALTNWVLSLPTVKIFLQNA